MNNHVQISRCVPEYTWTVAWAEQANLRTDFLNVLLPARCCGKCAIHAFRQSQASFSVSQVWWFHIRFGQSVIVQKCSFGVEYHELSSFSCFRFRWCPADHVMYARQQWGSCEVAVGPVLFYFTSDQSTSYFHVFVAALVDVFPAT